MKHIRKKLTGLLIFLSIPPISFSQITFGNGDTLVRIDIRQLRQANAIFLEHRFLLSETTELYRQITLMEALIVTKDSVIANQNIQLHVYKQVINTQQEQINSYKKIQERDRKKRIGNKVRYLGGGIIIGALLLMVIQ